MVIQMFEQPNRRAFSGGRHRARNESKRPASTGKCFEQRSNDRFSFALQDAVDRALGMA